MRFSVIFSVYKYFGLVPSQLLFFKMQLYILRFFSKAQNAKIKRTYVAYYVSNYKPTFFAININTRISHLFVALYIILTTSLFFYYTNHESINRLIDLLEFFAVTFTTFICRNKIVQTCYKSYVNYYSVKYKSWFVVLCVFYCV